MKSALTLAGAVAINLTALAVLEWEVTQTQTQLAPAGEVTITQLEEVPSLAPLAQAEVDGRTARTASSL